GIDVVADEGAVVDGRQQRTAVSGEENAIGRYELDSILDRSVAANALPGREVPAQDAVAVRDGGNLLTVRGEGDVAHPVLVPREDERILAAGQIAQMNLRGSVRPGDQRAVT